MEELNKKIAEWCGFRDVSHTTRHGEFCQYPGGQLRPSFPDFTTSPDACFEYIVPKLKKMGRGIRVQTDYDTNWCAEITPTPSTCTEYAEADTPALAFCRVVGKLINTEGGNDGNG